MKDKLKKTWRYVTIYGVKRTMVKVLGRTRSSNLTFLVNKRKKGSYISLIGCGQFGFSTICHFLVLKQGNFFLECYDPSKVNQRTAAQFWLFAEQNNPDKLINNSQCKLIYIASNHATHSEYAVKAIKAGKSVYIEKPIAVDYFQFRNLLEAREKSDVRIFVGYNRPFSKAVEILRDRIKSDVRQPITLNCFVVGHFIDADHWYRNPDEGTRICGNMGHWIDLSIHLFNSAGKMPVLFLVTISYSNIAEADDNITVTMTTEMNDLVVLTLSSRSEPFEGINETINFQSGEVIAKIDDFRKMKVWEGNKYSSYKFWPKDVGHERAINQPFNSAVRDFFEIEVSTVIMLEITDMVKRRETAREFRPVEILENLKTEKTRN